MRRGYRQQDRAKSRFDSLTLNGPVLFVTGLLVVASGLRDFRPSIGGLLFHPYLLPVALAALFVIPIKLSDLPGKVTSSLLLFTALFALTSLNVDSLPYLVKMLTATLSILTVALLVRSRADFVAGTAGLTIAIGLLAYRGIVEEDASLGVKAIDVANKNSYSMYALPAMLLAGFILLRVTKPVSRILIGALLISCLVSLVAIFMSANRSGYVGAVLVGIMLFWDRKFLGLILVAVIGFGLYYGLTHYGSTAIFEHRLEQTEEGIASDQLRVDLVKECIRIGFEHPFTGVTPAGLSAAFNRDWAGHQAYLGPIGPHNAFGLIFAGSGLICMAALVWAAWSLWFWPPPKVPRGRKPPSEFIEARKLMRYLLILWAVRGLFNDEIFYNPGFCIAIGLTMGLCLVSSKLPSVAAAGRVAPNRQGLAGAPP